MKKAQSHAEFLSRYYSFSGKVVAKAEELPKSGDETYLVGTAQEPPVESGRADLALYLASFHHIPENEMPALSKNAGESSRAKAL